MTHKRKVPKMHHGRLNLDRRCRICGAPSLEHCEFGGRVEDPRDGDDMALQSWLEFQVLAAVHNLKEVAPEHVLVRAVSGAISAPMQGDDLPAMLKRQAE